MSWQYRITRRIPGDGAGWSHMEGPLPDSGQQVLASGRQVLAWRLRWLRQQHPRHEFRLERSPVPDWEPVEDEGES